jgi:hypothetical protein
MDTSTPRLNHAVYQERLKRRLPYNESTSRTGIHALWMPQARVILLRVT